MTSRKLLSENLKVNGIFKKNGYTSNIIELLFLLKNFYNNLLLIKRNLHWHKKKRNKLCTTVDQQKFLSNYVKISKT